MFAAARCIVCHRFNGDGGATGPDLTQVAGRFNLHDLAESIVEPSKVIADQYRASVVTTTAGKVYTGRIIAEGKQTLTVLTDPEDPTKIVELKKTEVEDVSPSPVSLMPADLLNPLNENEVLDLLAYLLSRGDPRHPMFRR
jgi:putative heme-binding domain-containing protein